MTPGFATIAGSLPQTRESDMRRLAAPDRLVGLFAPRSIALVGASDTSGWSRNIYASLETAGYRGEIVPIHPRHRSVLDIPAKRSLRDLDEPVDLAFILTPTYAVEGVLDDAAAVGIHHVVVLAAGYSEQGTDGGELEDRLVDRAMRHDITLLGPNGLGFVNATTGAAPYGLVITPPLLSGPVGVVLQSGALASAVLAFAQARAIGLSLLVSMGNEAMVSTADVVDHLLEDDATKVIALFLEGIRQPERFAALAEKALEGGKPIVAVKVGRSLSGRRNALAHTGAIAGDDAVVDAALRQLGVIRVDSLEELLVTAGMLAYNPPLTGNRMGVVTASGGACDIIADRALDEGIEVPPFGAETVRALEGIVPDFANAQNPLDVTGFGLAHQRSGTTTAIDDALRVVAHDPNIDFVCYMGVRLPAVPPPDDLRPFVEGRMREVARAIRSAPVPVVPVGHTCVDVGPYAREVLYDNHVHVLGGMEFGLSAIGHALRCQRRRAERRGVQRPPREVLSPARTVGMPAGPWSEAEARELLAEGDVPLVPAELARTADEAAEAARRLGFPVALKVCSRHVTHKSDSGGVALNLTSATQVRKAFGRIRRGFRVQWGTEVDGVLVAPMRGGGVELLAGVSVDPTFGPVVTVGLGGIWVEVMRDVALRVLPVGRSEVLRMLDELRGAPLLRGSRATPAVDLGRVADAVVRLTETALTLGPALVAVEVNPLLADAHAVEALDALVVTSKRTARLPPRPLARHRWRGWAS
ncbi:MAG: acetate--CoA ligase family protein [Streptosporangiaceae bacterium]